MVVNETRLSSVTIVWHGTIRVMALTIGTEAFPPDNKLASRDAAGDNKVATRGAAVSPSESGLLYSVGHSTANAM